MRTKIFAAAALLAAVSPAAAQNGANYNLQPMNFDLWCQETAHLPPDRCDKRTPDDEKVFEDYRATIERYEIPYQQRKQNDLSLNRDILHNDPIDNPIPKDEQAQQQLPTEQPKTPSP